MADPVNASFEDPGATPGEADAWTVSVVFTGYLIADFAEGGIPKPVEDFTGASWGTDPYAYTVDRLTGTRTVFDASQAPSPSTVETFVRWANNNGYQTTVQGGTAMQFDAASATVEDFTEVSWGTATYATEVSVAAGNLGTSFAEAFESGWGSYTATVSGGTTARFDQSTKTVEDFESVSGDILFVVDPATDTCTATAGAHGKSNGFKVTITGTGAQPGGLADNQTYFFISVSGATFKLSKTLAGAAVDITDLGSGSHYVHADESLFWTQPA